MKKFSTYHLSTDELSDYDLPNKRIIFSTRTTASIIIDEKTYQHAIANEFDKIDKDIYTNLLDRQFIVDSNEDEFKTITQYNREIREKTNFLSMTIQPSANCQLGCHYCGQTHTKDYANKDVIEKYKERVIYLLDNRKDIYNGLAITWYGGEPLTGYSSIKKTSKELIEVCKERKFNYIADIITNGLSLKVKLFEELVKECLITHYQITIDGIAESHDKRRMTKSGEPTYDIIMRNIIEVTNTQTYKDYNCHISIRVNIDKTNHQFVDPLIDAIRANNLQGKVSMYFATIVDFGGNDAGKDSLSREFFASKEIDWLFKCYEYGIDVSTLPTRKYSVCMVDQQDSEVWDAFGNIYACWEFPYSDTYGKGDSLIGNLFQSPETYNKNATLRDWDETLESGKTWCKTCAHLPVCGGGCPKSWYEGTPACPTFKLNYKEKLLLNYYVKQNKTEFEKI